jgi:predicted lipoprotein
MKNSRVLIMGLAGGVIGFVLFLAACSKSGGKSDNTSGNGPDSVLVNLGKNIILPSYQQLAATTATLDAAVAAFTLDPTPETLGSAQSAFKEAYFSWAACSEFEFGPAADQYMTTHFTNAFPTDTVLIKANAGGSAYTLDGVGNFAAQGFPALDYLLFAYGDNATVARFTTSSSAAGAKQYLKTLSSSLKTKSAAVLNAWSASGGNYLDKFGKATGTDAGSSLSLMVNAFVMDFDVTLQNYKIGIPIGIYGPNTLPKSPEKVEAYYSGLSSQLLETQVKAYQDIYRGAAGGGLDDKIAATKAQSNGQPLNDVIKAQWTTLLTKIQILPAPLASGVQNNDPSINAAYTEVRKMTVLLKVDMSSALGIKISFQDDDGD